MRSEGDEEERSKGVRRGGGETEKRGRREER